jgi:hypothetical protein
MPSPTPEAWAEIRYAYEHTRRPVEDICFAHGITPNTLRRRLRRWGWRMRQPPIPDDGPPRLAMPTAAVEPVVPPTPTLSPQGGGAQAESAALVAIHTNPDLPADPEAGAALIAERLEGALARVLPAIETTLVRLTASPHPRETEQAARTLGVLMRTLRELNTLTGRYAPHGDMDETTDEDTHHDDAPPKDIDEFRFELARRINAFVDDHEARKAAENGDADEAA